MRNPKEPPHPFPANLTLAPLDYNNGMEFVYWIIPGQLAGRRGPTWSPWQPEELYAGGIRAVVSLATDVEVEDLTPYGFTHYRGNFPPVLLTSPGMQRAFVYEALKVWAFIHEQLLADKPTLVHCYAGQDRTGAVLAGYLVTYQGLTPEAAIRRVRLVEPGAMHLEGYADAVQLLEPGQLPDSRTLL